MQEKEEGRGFLFSFPFFSITCVRFPNDSRFQNESGISANDRFYEEPGLDFQLCFASLATFIYYLYARLAMGTFEDQRFFFLPLLFHV